MNHEAEKVSDDEWTVEAIGGDGEVYVTRFHGLRAEDRAREYAAWKNGGSAPLPFDARGTSLPVVECMSRNAS